MNKKTYITPQIEVVELDNEIALVLESNPPVGPFETNNDLSPECFGSNQFKNIQA